jgi:hypothetical protein
MIKEIQIKELITTDMLNKELSEIQTNIKREMDKINKNILIIHRRLVTIENKVYK